MDTKQTKKILLGITYTVVLAFLLYRISDVVDISKNLFNVVKPFIIGAAIAFILSIPLNFLEKKFKNLKRPVSLILTFFIFILVILVLIFLVGPKLVETVSSIISTIPVAIDNLHQLANKYNLDWNFIQNFITSAEIDWNSLSNKVLEIFKNSFGNIFTSTFGFVSGFVSGIVSTIISIIFAVYILISKEKLSVQLKKLLYAFLPEHIVDKMIEIGKLTHKTFTSFFTFQCVECVILGFLFFITMVVLRIPYALLISVMIAIMALVPIFGLCIAFIVASILIVMVDPIKVVVFAILFAILQQIEGNLIYPRVVGKSIGLPPIWTIAAITIGANLMGIVGMLLFIPLSSVIYTLITKEVYRRIRKKEISSDKWL